MPEIKYKWGFHEVYGYSSTAKFISDLPGWAQPLAKVAPVCGVSPGYFVIFYPEESI